MPTIGVKDVLTLAAARTAAMVEAADKAANGTGPFLRLRASYEKQISPENAISLLQQEGQIDARPVLLSSATYREMELPEILGERKGKNEELQNEGSALYYQAYPVVLEAKALSRNDPMKIRPQEKRSDFEPLLLKREDEAAQALIEGYLREAIVQGRPVKLQLLISDTNDHVHPAIITYDPKTKQLRFQEMESNGGPQRSLAALINKFQGSEHHSIGGAIQADYISCQFMSIHMLMAMNDMMDVDRNAMFAAHNKESLGRRDGVEGAKAADARFLQVAQVGSAAPETQERRIAGDRNLLTYVGERYAPKVVGGGFATTAWRKAAKYIKKGSVLADSMTDPQIEEVIARRTSFSAENLDALQRRSFPEFYAAFDASDKLSRPELHTENAYACYQAGISYAAMQAKSTEEVASLTTDEALKAYQHRVTLEEYDAISKIEDVSRKALLLSDEALACYSALYLKPSDLERLDHARINLLISPRALECYKAAGFSYDDIKDKSDVELEVIFSDDALNNYRLGFNAAQHERIVAAADPKAALFSKNAVMLYMQGLCKFDEMVELPADKIEKLTSDLATYLMERRVVKFDHLKSVEVGQFDSVVLGIMVDKLRDNFSKFGDSEYIKRAFTLALQLNDSIKMQELIEICKKNNALYDIMTAEIHANINGNAKTILQREQYVCQLARQRLPSIWVEFNAQEVLERAQELDENFLQIVDTDGNGLIHRVLIEANSVKDNFAERAEGALEVVQALIERGVDINAQNQAGKSGLDLMQRLEAKLAEFEKGQRTDLGVLSGGAKESFQNPKNTIAEINEKSGITQTVVKKQRRPIFRRLFGGCFGAKNEGTVKGQG